MYSKIREALLQKSGAQNVSPGAGTGYKLQFFIPSGGRERSALEPAPQALLMGASVRTATLRAGVDLSSLVTPVGGSVWSAQGCRGSQLLGKESQRGTDVLSHCSMKKPAPFCADECHRNPNLQETSAVTNSPVRTHSANPEPWKLGLRGRAYLSDLSGPQNRTLKCQSMQGGEECLGVEKSSPTRLRVKATVGPRHISNQSGLLGLGPRT